MGMAVEVAELMEHFLYTDAIKPEDKQAVAHELIDVLWWVISFANNADIDIAQAFAEKIKLNAAKYPIDKAKGKATKYTAL
jgi:NTP pyrophosphatase (non-canonical NTP hydrolase)